MCTKYELVLLLVGFEFHIVFSPEALFISYSVKCYSKKKKPLKIMWGTFL